MAESIVESSTEAVLNVARTERLRVLHVDDDQAFLKVAKQCLEMQGEIDVDTVSSVNEASEKLKKTDYDAIVCDYQMPGKTGLEFLKELRAGGNTIPFIVFTGKGREEVAVKALNLGADGYCNKHGEPETVYGELAHGIRQAVERQRALTESERSNEMLRTAIAYAGVGISLLDTKGIHISVNSAFCEMVGYSSEELIGTGPPHKYWPKDEKEQISKRLRGFLKEGKQPPQEHVFQRKNGEKFPVLITASPVKDEKREDVAYVGIVQDITERKKAEEEMRKSEMILENIADSIIVTDLQGRITSWNEGASKIFGFGAEEMLGENIAKVSKPKEREQVAPAQLEQVRKGVLFLGEWEGVRKDGEPVWLMLTTKLLKNSQGETVGMIGVGKDIAERKKAEEALRGSEEKYRNLVENSQDGIAIVNFKGNVLFANKAAERLTGYTLKEGKGLNIRAITPKRYWPKSVAMLLKARMGKPIPYFEYELKRKDGTTVPVETGGQAIFEDGKPVAIQIITRETTERRKAEEEVKSSEQKFRGLVEDSAAAIATIDLKGRLTYVNRALADSLGYSVQEMSGRAFKDFVHPDDGGRLVRLFLKIIVLRRKPRKFEFRALRKDGAILHFTCRPTRLETAGKTVGFQAIIMDSTAEKRMLERAEKTSEKLSVVGGLTRHDVNNKLSTILNVSYLLKQKLRDNQSLELVKETESAVHQIEGLFEFARTYEKLGTEELAYVDAEKVFNEAARLFPSLKDIRIVNDCHGLTLFADSLLRQLFYNLIDNSLKHGEKVGKVTVHYEISEDHLKLIYDDDGIGIPKAEKDKIFKEGYGKARGHGLYLIKKMCEVYGWTIQETGRQGKGAQFTINMPKAKPDGKPNCKLG